jgi:hypothetical protein
MTKESDARTRSSRVARNGCLFIAVLVLALSVPLAFAGEVHDSNMRLTFSGGINYWLNDLPINLPGTTLGLAVGIRGNDRCWFEVSAGWSEMRSRDHIPSSQRSTDLRLYPIAFGFTALLDIYRIDTKAIFIICGVEMLASDLRSKSGRVAFSRTMGFPVGFGVSFLPRPIRLAITATFLDEQSDLEAKGPPDCVIKLTTSIDMSLKF